MVSPKILCNQHLLGEHNEIHKAVGNLRHTGIWAKALINKGFLEPQNFKKRHDELVVEMVSRGMNHQSPLNVKGLKLTKGKIDTKKALKDLMERCDKCRRRQKQIVNKK